jgi:hypothetical protein
VNLQPFFDLITIHELGHAFEVLGDFRLPTFWLSETFVNLPLHALVATRLPASLPTLEVLSTVGAGSRKLAARMRAEGYSTLEELQTHYAGSDDSDPSRARAAPSRRRGTRFSLAVQSGVPSSRSASSTIRPSGPRT